MRRRPNETGPLLWSLALALGLHGAVLLPALSDALLHPSAHDKGGRVRITTLSKAQWEKNRRVLAAAPDVQRPPPPSLSPPKKPVDDEAQAPGRVVSLPPPAKQERPEHADYAAEHEQKTDRETRSRYQTPDFLNPTARPQDGARIEAAAPPSPTERASPQIPEKLPGGPKGEGRALAGSSGTDDTSGAGERLFALELPKRAPRQGLHLEVSEEGALQNRPAVEGLVGNSDQARLAMGRAADMARRSGDGGENEAGQGLAGGAGKDGMPSLEALTPSLGQLERIAGMPANDYLPDVETDVETRLNAWRWKHATFFQRVFRAVNRAWTRELDQNVDFTLEAYGVEDRFTDLAVTVDRTGAVTAVEVYEASGARPLDDAAVAAFRAAGPFPNPPEALFQGKEKFTFHFAFYVDVQDRQFDLNWRPY